MPYDGSTFLKKPTLLSRLRGWFARQRDPIVEWRPIAPIVIVPEHSREWHVYDDMLRLLSSPARWAKGALRMINGKDKLPMFCMLGAIAEVTGEDVTHGESPYADKLTFIIRRRHNRVFRHVVAFNDHPSTTYQDVINVVRETRDSCP